MRILGNISSLLIALAASHIGICGEENLIPQIAQVAREGKHEQAVELATKAAENESTRADAYYLRARSQFCLGKIHESLADFDRYVEMRPDLKPQQWERGIACYYAGEFQMGAEQFELYQTYHDNDVENSVWRFLCLVPIDGVEKARRTMLPIRDDRRVPMMQIYQLFRGEGTVEDVLAAVDKGEPDEEEKAYRLFYARLYLGLYYEAIGEEENAKKYVLLAADEHRTTQNINRYMWSVADVHAKKFR